MRFWAAQKKRKTSGSLSPAMLDQGEAPYQHPDIQVIERDTPGVFLVTVNGQPAGIVTGGAAADLAACQAARVESQHETW